MLETIFSLGSGAAMLGWLGLILLPFSRAVVDGVSGLLIPLLLSTAYIGLIFTSFSGADGGFDSLAAVGLLFQTPEMLLAGWLHYLAFDLFVGAAIVRIAGAERVPHLAVVPCLVGTFLFGPLGFFLFTALRFGLTGGWRASRPEVAR
jgi:hypothetical protein